MNILVLAAESPATLSMPGSPRLFNLCRSLAKNHRLSLVTGCQLKAETRGETLDLTIVKRIIAECLIVAHTLALDL